MTLKEMIDNVLSLVSEARLPGATGLYDRTGRMICYGDLVSIDVKASRRLNLAAFQDCDTVSCIVLKVHDSRVVYLPDGTIYYLEPFLEWTKVLERVCVSGCDSPLLRDAPIPWAETMKE